MWVLCANTGTDFTYTIGQWSPGWQIRRGDFDADGRDDLFLYNRHNGIWFEAFSTSSGFEYHSGQWSAGWQVEVGDFDANGQDDVIVYDPTSGVFVRCLTGARGGMTYAIGTWKQGLTLITGKRLP